MISTDLIRFRFGPTILASTLFITAFFSAAAAFTADERIRFRRYDMEDGLAQDSVSSIVHDHLGYLWIAGGGGLQRFDGYRFETFYHDPERPGSLPNQDVYKLLEDHLGRLWIGTVEGIALYDRSLKSFRSFDLPDGPARVNVLLQDREKTLWIATPVGLYRLPLGQGEDLGEVRSAFEGLIPGDPKLADSRVNALEEDHHGNLWIGTRAGLYRLSKTNYRYRLDHFRYDPEDPQSVHDDELYALLQDRSGDLWLGAWGGGGLSRLPADQLLSENPRFQQFLYPIDDRRGLQVQSEVVKSLLEDRDGTLWIGTQREGVRLLTAAERRRDEPRFRVLEHDPLDPTSLPPSTVWALTQDEQGGIWAGTNQGGLAYHHPSTAAVALIRPAGPSLTPGANRVTTVAEGRDGIVWVGTVEGLHRIRKPNADDDSFAAQHFRHDPNDPSTLAADRIEDVFEDRRGRLWVGTIRGGLDLLADDRKPRFLHHGKAQGMAPTIFKVYEDRGGEIWVGTYSGLRRLVEEPQGSDRPARFAQMLHDPDDPATISSDVVYGFAEDRQDRLWIFTDDGVDRLSPDRTTLQRIPELEGKVFHHIEASKDGFIWAASDTSGLTQIDPETDQVRIWRLDDRPAAELSRGVLIDLSGRVWSGSARRLYRIDTESGEKRVFNTWDGFLNAPFGNGSFFSGQTGDLYVGGYDGVAMFSSQELIQPPLLAPVVLRDLLFAQRPTEVDPDGPLPQSLETTTTLTLRPEEKNFSLEFAALTFHRQEFVRYAYRLQGYTDEWTEADSHHRQATFTNLSPGAYVFEVKARNDVDSWSPQTASLEIVVLPYWYQTRAFQIAVAVLLIGLPAAWIWLRFRRLEAHRRRLQELVDRWRLERKQRRSWQEVSMTAARIARRTRDPLTRIRRLAERILNSDDLNEENRKRADDILQQAGRTDSQWEEFISYALLPQPEVREIDLGALIDGVLLDLDHEIREADVPIRQEVHGVRIQADEKMLTRMLHQMILQRLQARAPGDALIFTFESRGPAGRLRIEDQSRAISRTDEDSRDARESRDTDGLGFAWVERLAEHQDWTLGIEEDDDGTGALVKIDGLRLA